MDCEGVGSFGVLKGRARVLVSGWTLVTTLAACGAAAPAAAQPPPSTQGGAYTLRVTPVFEHPLPLEQNASVSCETRNLSGGDPVLHVLSPETEVVEVFTRIGQRTEVAHDDNTAGALNARVFFRAAEKGDYLLVLRARTDTPSGAADVWCNGAVVATQVRFGGAFVRVTSLRTPEVLQTVPLVRGPLAHQVYLLNADGTILVQRRSRDSHTTSLGQRSHSSVTVMVGGAAGEPDGDIRLVRNDRAIAGHDPDGDRLGSELEAAIGTCSTRTDLAGGDWECSRSIDLRDTDGDGLRDDLELLGAPAPAPAQLLPRWGADPRHKDLFIEADYGEPRDHRAMKMPPALARRLAEIYGDQEADPVLRGFHAWSLRNPDGRPGISLHVDTGRDPADAAPAADWTLYGDWGGYTHVPGVNVDGEWKLADGPSVWESHMAASRKGIFHYALGYLDGGGQAPFESIALNMPWGNLEDERAGVAGTAAHELGHTLNLDHSGSRTNPIEANCKPNYPSVMSYAYSGAAEAMEDGPGEGMEDDTGRTPPGPDGTRPRQFYRFSNTFSDGGGRAPLNNTALRERGAVSSPASPQGVRYLKDLERLFSFEVDHATGDVDWNRDGVIADRPVKARANDNGSCEFTALNVMSLDGPLPSFNPEQYALSDGAPAIARLGRRTFLFYADERDRRLHLAYTDHDLECPPALSGCGPDLRQRPVERPWNRGVLTFDAHAFTEGERRRLLVVFTTDDGIFETTTTGETTLAGDFDWSLPTRIPTSSRVVDEMSLAGSGAEVVMAYKNTDGYPLVKRRAADGTWGPDDPVVDPAGIPIGPLGVLSAPALLEAALRDGRRVLFGVFPVGEQGRLQLYVEHPGSHRWVPVESDASREFIGQPWVWDVTGAAQRIERRGLPGHALHVEDGLLKASLIADGDASAEWIVEGLESPYVRIRHRLRPDRVLYLEGENLRAGTRSPGSGRDQWLLEPADAGFVRIRNRAEPTHYIHAQSGSPVAGPIQPDWTSAQWAVRARVVRSDEATIGRPALAWEPVDDDSALPGRLRILYLHRSELGRHVVRTRVLEVARTYRGAVKHVLRDRDFQNVWYYANGVDVLFEAGVDTNLRALVATALDAEGRPRPHTVEFRPKADGIVDVTYGNFDDWSELGRQLCRRLAAVGAQVACP